MTRGRFAALLAAAALAACFAGLTSQEAALAVDARRNPDYARVGESLVHGLRDGSAGDRMPAPSLLSSASAYHMGRGGRTLLLASAAVLQGLLIFALGAMVGSPIGGLAAAAVHGLAGWGRFSGPASVQSWFAVPVLVAACAWVWRCRRPTPARGAAAAAAVGMTFFFRSTLLFLPPLLALWASREKSAGPRWRHAALLLLLPYAFLLPRAAALKAAEGSWIFLERHEAGAVAAAGALGVVEGGASDWRALSGREDGALAWAAAEAAARPLDYLSSCLRRLGRILSEHPALYSAALAGFFLMRRRREAWAAALFPAYFILAHSGLAVHREYLLPALGPACLLACAGAASALKRDADSPLWRERGVKAVAAGAAACALLALVSLGALAVYAFAPEPGSLDEERKLAPAAAARPGDGWLDVRRGRSLLASARYAEAQAEFARAAALGTDSAAALESLRARWLYGDASPLLAGLGGAVSMEDDVSPELLALRAGAVLESEKTARAEKAAAWDAYLRRRSMTRGTAAGEAGSRLRAAAGRDAARFFFESVLRYRTIEERKRLLARFAAFDSRGPWFRLESARQALLMGDAVSARAMLPPSPPDDADARRLWAELSVDAGARGRAVELMTAADFPRPGSSPEDSLRLADRMTAAGRPAAALELIDAAARGLKTVPGRARLARARALAASGRTEEALALAEEAVAGEPDRLAFYLDLAALYEKAGRRAEARTAVERGLSRAAPAEERRLHKAFLEERLLELQ